MDVAPRCFEERAIKTMRFHFRNGDSRELVVFLISNKGRHFESGAQPHKIMTQIGRIRMTPDHDNYVIITWDLITNLL